MRKTTQYIGVSLLSGMLFFSSCTKWLEIAPPIDSVTTEEMFSNNKQAELALNGIYSKLIHGTATTGGITLADKNFAAGLTTITLGLSADELTVPPSVQGGDVSFTRNNVIPSTSTKSNTIWNTAYRTVYDATAVIQGVEASESTELVESVRKQVIGEALTLRALGYFYLVNCFGDLPLVLTTDTKQLASLRRSPAEKIYEQIISDLERARTLLNENFSHSGNEKIRVNKWVAEALLARVYLYTGKYPEAVSSATAVINQTGLFKLEDDLANVFLKNSTEAIFQLKQNQNDAFLKMGTPEGQRLFFSPTVSGAPPAYILSDQLINSFEAGDLRKSEWTASYPPYYTPLKYKNGQGREYYMVMRLAELYLVRAEANLRSNSANVNAAIADLNLLRERAGLDKLPDDLPSATVLEAIAQERRVELFLEWGHRWLDLKRTGKASEVLSQISYKQPWWGDFQLLYPVPLAEIKNNNLLDQNPEYDNY